MICMEKDPNHRYSTAEYLADDLDRWLAKKPIKRRPASLTVRVRRWIQRNRTGAALIATLFVGLLLTAGLLLLVNAEKRKLIVTNGTMVSSVSEKIERLWRDPNCESVQIRSDLLAALDNRDPPDPVSLTNEFNLGVVADGPEVRPPDRLPRRAYRF